MTDNKELIERLREAERMAISSADRETHKKAADALAKADELIQQQAAALAEKDAALVELDQHAKNSEQFCGGAVDAHYILNFTPPAIAIQPHADLVRKMKADAVRGAANNFQFGACSVQESLLAYADRIERGEVE